jgi:hypothetical protein
MNDARTTRKTASRGPLRSQRRAGALVAQYIHELSDRHGSPAAARRPPTGIGADRTVESQGG